MNDFVGLRRDRVTPTDYGLMTISWVSSWFDRYADKLERDGRWFWKAFDDSMHSSDRYDGYDADYFLDLARRGVGGKLLMTNQITAIIACCVASHDADAWGDKGIAWTLAADAREAAATMTQFWGLSFDAPRWRAARAAYARLANDPKQAAKHEARKLWEERHAGKHPKLRTQEQFAIECMRRWPILSSPKVIVGWCTWWNKQAKRKPQPAS